MGLHAKPMPPMNDEARQFEKRKRPAWLGWNVPEMFRIGPAAAALFCFHKL
jgi:hypothetical protein